MPPQAFVLYEDSRGDVKQFGLHELVAACVAEQLGRPVQLDGRPLKGNSNVRKSCKRPSLIARKGQPVIAVLDKDRAHTLVNLPASASDREIIDAFTRDCEAPQLLHVCLLDRNQESVIAAVASCDATLDVLMVETRASLPRARRKDRNARDAVLKEASRIPALRRCVLERVPSLRAVVELLARLLSGSLAT